MRKILILCLCLLWGNYAMADNVIKLNDETLIEGFTSISFDPMDNGHILIHFADESYVSVNMNILQVLPNATSAIEKLQPTNVARISQLVGDQLVIEGATVGEDIRLFSVEGTLMTQCKALTETVTLDLGRCKSGIYILCIGQKVIKFNKQ